LNSLKDFRNEGWTEPHNPEIYVMGVYVGLTKDYHMKGDGYDSEQLLEKVGSRCQWKI